MKINEVKQFRERIDTLINSYTLLKGSREVSLSKTSAQLGKMWLGKALAKMGNNNPYPHSSNPNSSAIEKQAEHSENTILALFESWEKELIDARKKYAPQIVRVKCMREELDSILMRMDELISAASPNDLNKFKTEYDRAVVLITESKMWLGEELNMIRDIALIEPALPEIKNEELFAKIPPYDITVGDVKDESTVGDENPVEEVVHEFERREKQESATEKTSNGFDGECEGEPFYTDLTPNK